MSRDRILVIAVMTLVLLAETPATAGTGTKPGCARELAATETSLRKTLLRLQLAATAKPDEKCAIYRDHAEVVARARTVFERCSTGRDRDQDIGQMDGTLDRVKGVIARSCAQQ